jgi:ankyrin repeat protein
MTENALHRAVLASDAEALAVALAAADSRAGLEARDAAGWTPLMRAVAGGGRTLALTRALLEAGADAEAHAETQFVGRLSVLRLALQAGEVAAVASVLDAGAELHYDVEGYDALLDAVHGRDLRRDPELLGLLQLLVARGVRLDRVTRDGESGLRTLSYVGRFDAVVLLLQAGAPETQLGWTPLIAAVAHGDRAALARRLQADAATLRAGLEQRDVWQRTAWHVALLAGRPDLAEMLRQAGTDVQARGRGGRTSLSYAVHSHDPSTLRYLLASGAALEDRDDVGRTALMEATDLDDVAMVELLREAGARDMERT